LSTGHERYTIDLGPDEQDRIGAMYFRQFGEKPTARELEALLDRYIREEIFLREGLALNLDKNDEVIRRRIVQKYEFLQSDLQIPKSPDKAVLERWFDQHKSHYMRPERASMSHIYFRLGPDEELARRRASAVLQELRTAHAGGGARPGDAFPGPSDINDLTPEEAKRLFGDSELSRQLFHAPTEQWVGPYRSGYGWHLVYVTSHSPPALAPLDRIHEQVLNDYISEQRRAQNDFAFQQLRAKYTIRYDGERQ
jgi:parvulin-like peptidyl-prolyl isomerase